MADLRELNRMKAKLEKERASAAEKTFVPIFVPMGTEKGSDTIKCWGEDVPVHTSDVITRGMAMRTWLDEGTKEGAAGAVYRTWFLCVACAVLTLITLPINVWVAAVFAFLTGHYWGWRMLNDAWGLQWYKGKSLTYTP